MSSSWISARVRPDRTLAPWTSVTVIDCRSDSRPQCQLAIYCVYCVVVLRNTGGWVDALQPGDPLAVGTYRLLKRLGSGGMGRVYLRRVPGGRLVAVKLIRPELADDPDFRRRFAQEVHAARRVSGIFTAPVVDADPDGPQPWLVTAYVDGPSLAEAVTAQGPMPVESVLTLAAGLAEGLGAVHAAGVVHRDLKPAERATGRRRAAHHRLRHLPHARRRRPDQRQWRRRLAWLYVARAGRGSSGRAADRHLQPRRRTGVRGDRRAAVRRGLGIGPAVPGRVRRGGDRQRPRTAQTAGRSAAWPRTRPTGPPPTTCSPSSAARPPQTTGWRGTA